LIGLAADESRLRSERIYWEADLRGWRFYSIVADERRLLTDDLLRERNWDRPLTRIAIYEGAAKEPSQVIMAAGAAPIRLPVAREWIAPSWRLELATDAGRAVVDIDPAGRSHVALQ
jgi:hypothetical protein